MVIYRTIHRRTNSEGVLKLTIVKWLRFYIVERVLSPMKQTLPQEVEVWYLIPSLRKEFTRIFIKEHKMNQKEAAKVLGVTESAVSQYLKSKRANEIKFSKEEIKEIKKSVERTVKDKKQLITR